MARLSDVVAQLSASRMATMPETGGGDSRLRDLTFAPNPGALRAYLHVPDGLANGAPLVLVLHGCTQTAAGYDAGAGWSEMADRHGFVVLFAEQQRQNNPNLCFTWFSPAATRRGQGEVASIRQMIAVALDAHRLDPARVFVTGLSAGGAMTSALLACYPEVFAGGAIIAGLPHGVAGTMPEALNRMRHPGTIGDDELGALVRRASDHTGPWPAVSVWHGDRDTTVSPANGQAIVRQWRSVHAVADEAGSTTTVDGCTHRTWADRTGRAVIEEFVVPGLGHGTPIDTVGADRCGRAGAHMLEAGISSTHHICRFWGLIDRTRHAGGEHRNPAVAAAASPATDGHARAGAAAGPSGGAGGRDVGTIIEDALRAAGLMR